MAERDDDGVESARRRQERQLRSFLKHEELSVKMTLARALHRSVQRVEVSRRWRASSTTRHGDRSPTRREAASITACGLLRRRVGPGRAAMPGRRCAVAGHAAAGWRLERQWTALPSPTMGAEMIVNQGFLFLPPIPAQNNRDLAKDPRIPENGRNDFPV